MHFRTANEGDLPRLLELHLAAYPDPRSVVARERNFTRNPFGKLDRLVVAVDGKRIVAHAFLFRLKAFWGGRAVKVGGIASLGVAPEARRHGIGTALVEELHRRSAAHGDAVTLLYAFRQTFYRRLGYAPTSSRKRLVIDPRSIPWSTATTHPIRAARGRDKTTIEAIHARAAARSTGMIERTRRLWERLHAREDRVVLAAPRGYVAFNLDQAEAHAATVLEIEELLADDDATRRSLLGAIGAMGDQVEEVILEVAESDRIEHALMDLDGRRHGTAPVEHSLGEIVGGPMVRWNDPKRAIEARGYEADGSFVLKLDDGLPLHIEVRKGTATATRRQTQPHGVTDPAGAVAVFFGGLSVRDGIGLGLVTGTTAAADRIDAIVSLPSFHAIDPF